MAGAAADDRGGAGMLVLPAFDPRFAPESLPMRNRFFALSILGVAVVLAGCHHAMRPDGTRVDKKGVSNLPGFESFIATHPTPQQFKALYPGVQLMLPGTLSSLDVRYDNTRFFPSLDKDGRIIGGDFH
jgi:hypothetical protein